MKPSNKQYLIFLTWMENDINTGGDDCPVEEGWGVGGCALMDIYGGTGCCTRVKGLSITKRYSDVSRKTINRQDLPHGVARFSEKDNNPTFR